MIEIGARAIARLHHGNNPVAIDLFWEDYILESKAVLESEAFLFQEEALEEALGNEPG